MPLLADGIDHVVALAPARRHLEDDLRRILKICVHDDDRVAGRDVQAGGHRHLVPEVPGQPQDLQARVRVSRSRHQRVGAVAAPVVDEDGLARAVQAIEQKAQSANQFRKRRFLVVHGDDNRVFRPTLAVHSKIASGLGPIVMA